MRLTKRKKAVLLVCASVCFGVTTLHPILVIPSTAHRRCGAGEAKAARTEGFGAAWALLLCRGRCCALRRVRGLLCKRTAIAPLTFLFLLLCCCRLQACEHSLQVEKVLVCLLTLLSASPLPQKEERQLSLFRFPSCLPTHLGKWSSLTPKAPAKQTVSAFRDSAISPRLRVLQPPSSSSFSSVLLRAFLSQNCDIVSCL